MKNFLLSLLLVNLCLAGSSNTYYSQGSLAPSNLSAWNTVRTGGGSTPTDFTTSGDIFIIQNGHVMATTAIWTFGSATSTLEIESGGLLQGNHSILLTGTFKLDNGGSYSHNNTASVSSTAGASIFGGTESFGASSNVAINNWINNTTTLPAGVNWGNLVINYAADIGGDWNQKGNLTAIQGDLIVQKTGTSSQQFQLTDDVDLSLVIAGSLEVQGGILVLKTNSTGGTTAFVQVNLDLIVTGGTLDLGDVDNFPNCELRFKRNLNIVGGVVTSIGDFVLLVANGSGTQTLSSDGIINTSVKINSGSTAVLGSSITIGQFKTFVIAGTCNAGSNQIISDGEGQLIVAGGILNSGANINMKNSGCTVCTATGNYSPVTQWCANTGNIGQFYYTGGTMQFNRSGSSLFHIGDVNSRGEVYFSNTANIDFNGPLNDALFGTVELIGNSLLSMTQNTIIAGKANYYGNGGSMIIGSSGGITQSALDGNIQVDGSRNYSSSGANSFEYKGVTDQYTGDGLPATITGILKINNIVGSGNLFLSTTTTIGAGGALNLTSGRLNTSEGSILALSNGATITGGSSSSYIEGPLIKIGNTNFTFPVGKTGTYSPIVMENAGVSNPADSLKGEYFPGNPQLFGINYGPGVDHISTLEYWRVDQIGGPATSPKKLTFSWHPESAVSNLAALIVGFFDGVDTWVTAGNDAMTGDMSNGTIQITANNFGPFTLASSDATNVLPVKLNYFTARKENGSAVLNWEISRDEQPEYFEIYSSTDNRTFIPIGKLAGVENQFKYSFRDPSVRRGTVYYRLRVAVKGGNKSLSRIVALIFDGRGLQILSVSPTIVQAGTTINIISSGKSKVQFIIVNTEGKLVRSFSSSVSEGSNALMINVGNLSTGIYYLTGISENGRSNVLRFIKQ